MWHENNLVFPSTVGTELDRSHVRRAFKKVTSNAGLGEDWTPRELRHTFVSLMSDSGIPLEEIARLVGHSGTATTESVYRHQLTPVLQSAGLAMDKILRQWAEAEADSPPSLRPEYCDVRQYARTGE